ncbi:MAG: TIGR01777 family oxidoreductase [Pseudoxanthomonas sp.]
MQVLVTGGSGFIGQALCPALLAAGMHVTVLTRNVERVAGQLAGVRLIERLDDMARADAVVNLAGASLAGQRWTHRYKQILRESRLRTTEALLAWMQKMPLRPHVLVSGSAIGYYGPRDDTPLMEESAPGDDFAAQLCRDWEAAALPAQDLGVRVCLLRTGVVLGADGGALQQMLLPYRFGLGGPISGGAQWMSWIHRRDLVRMIQWLLQDANTQGPCNGTAPEPIRQREFAQQLAEAVHRPAMLPTPALALKLAVGEMADMLVHGQKVLPAYAQQHGFQFDYPRLEDALRQILPRA